MISDYDKKLLTEAGREYLFDITINSNVLKDKLTFKEHVVLCNQVKKLTYEEVITLLVTEDIRDFEGKFSKFLKYSIAAIAGLAGGLFGPPVTMFILYLYRKASDTCERSCFKNMPLSTKRKICRYECQLNAAKKMETDIRANVSKCAQTARPDKCEKKLQGEYIKWAKRVQMLTVKVNKAKLDVEEKLRKQNQKTLVKRAKALRASFNLTPAQFKYVVLENKELRKALKFSDHLRLYNTCISEQDDRVEVGPVKIDPKTEKMIRTAISVGLFAVPIPGIAVAFMAIVKKFNAACATKCLSTSTEQTGMPRNVCYTKCSYLGAKYAVGVLSKEIGKCSKAKEPIKCKRKIYDMLEDWKQREAERKIKFESTLRNELRKAKAKNQKR
jgi:hypothetical protein